MSPCWAPGERFADANREEPGIHGPCVLAMPAVTELENEMGGEAPLWLFRQTGGKMPSPGLDSGLGMLHLGANRSYP